MIQIRKIGNPGAIEQWDLSCSDFSIYLRPSAIQQCLILIGQWIQFFPKEETFVQGRFGVPSLIVRLDMVVDGEGVVRIYEVEERPAGIGITGLLNPQFKRLFDNLRLTWPHFKYVASPHRRGGDDHMWLEGSSTEDALASDDLLLVRAEPNESVFHRFLGRSISTLVSKGDKSYGIPMGLWSQITQADFETLPWPAGFCVKPIQGSKCRDVHIWKPGRDGGRGRGSSTRGQIQRVLLGNTMLVQRLIEPVRMDIEGMDLNVIFRVFFGFNPSNSSWISLGGLWNGRPVPEMKIHGSSNTVFGPVVI